MWIASHRLAVVLVYLLCQRGSQKMSVFPSGWGGKNTLENTQEAREDSDREGMGGKRDLSALWNGISHCLLRASAQLSQSRFSTPSVFIDPSSLSWITPPHLSSIPHPPSISLFLLSDRWNNEVAAAACCFMQQERHYSGRARPHWEQRGETLFAALILFPQKFLSGKENIRLYLSSAAPLVICSCVRLTMTSKLKAR